MPNDYGIGGQAARYGRHLIKGDVNVIEIQGRKGSTPTDQRHSGFVDAVKGTHGMEIIASEHGNWNMEDAMALVDSLLDVYPQTNMIYAHNDRMAIGASQVARSRGRGDIKS